MEAHAGRESNRRAELFWEDEQSTDQQLEAVAAIAAHMKFRTKSVLALAADKRARYLATLPNLSDTIAARALVNYHLAKQRPMMAAFLDSVGVAHEEGLITEEEIAKPDTEKLKAAAAAVAGRIPGGGRRALSLDPRVAGPRDLGRARRTAADGSRLSEGADFGSRPAAALDRAVHVALPVRARVLTREQDPRPADARATAAAPDRMTDRSTA